MDQTGGASAVVMEATGYYSRELARYFQQLRPGLPVFIANPYLIKKYGEGLGVQTKTDAQDTRVIACFGVERKLRPTYEMKPEHLQLQRLHKDRDALVDMLKRVRQRAFGAERGAVSLDVHERLCRELKQGIKDLDEELGKVVAGEPSLKNEVELLSSLPGVAMKTASLILGILGDLRRFGRNRELSAFAGVAPKLKDSGKTVHGKTVLNKRGNPRIRKALYLSALAAVRKEGPMRQIYLDLVAKGKAKMSALGAIMRRLLVLMRAIIISGIAYDPMLKGQPSATKS
jgi:transposase